MSYELSLTFNNTSVNVSPLMDILMTPTIWNTRRQILIFMYIYSDFVTNEQAVMYSPSATICNIWRNVDAVY